MTQWIISSILILIVIALRLLLPKRIKPVAPYALICLILSASITVGCTFTGDKQPDASDNRTESTESTENTKKLPTSTPGTPLTSDELSRFTELFSGLTTESGDPNWYNLILFCGRNITDTQKGFLSPEDINFGTLFNNGFGEISFSSNWTPEELAFIQGFYPGYPQNWGDLYRLPAAMMDQVLSDYLGITIEQSNKVGLDAMEYFPDTNCYFGAPAGATGETKVNMVDGKRCEDGTIYLLQHKATTDDKPLLLRLVPNPGNEKIPYRVHTCTELEEIADLSAVLQSTARLPSAAVNNAVFNSKYFLFHNRPGSEPQTGGYDGKPYALGGLAENGLYAVDDGVVCAISVEPINIWTKDMASGYVYFVRQNDPGKIWRTDLHGQNPTPVYEAQNGEVTFLSYYHDSQDWLFFIENNRCTFYNMTVKTMVALPKVYYVEQFSYDAAQTRVFWKGQLNASDPAAPAGGYTYYYYPETGEYQTLTENFTWVTVTPEA